MHALLINFLRPAPDHFLLPSPDALLLMVCSPHHLKAVLVWLLFSVWLLPDALLLATPCCWSASIHRAAWVERGKHLAVKLPERCYTIALPCEELYKEEWPFGGWLAAKGKRSQSASVYVRIAPLGCPGNDVPASIINTNHWSCYCSSASFIAKHQPPANSSPWKSCEGKEHPYAPTVVIWPAQG
jgi:hypothetical protein